MEKISLGGVFELKNKSIGFTVAGFAAGAVNGLFGAGGGMVLVPLLDLLTDLEDREVFPASVCIIAPVCIVSLVFTWQPNITPWDIALPYLLASAAGGVAAGFLAKKVPTLWLHRFLGILILWGGIRYLC